MSVAGIKRRLLIEQAVSGGSEPFTEILNEIHVTRLLFSGSYRIAADEQRFWKKRVVERLMKAPTACNTCAVFPEKSVYTVARGDGRGNYKLPAQKLKAPSP